MSLQKNKLWLKGFCLDRSDEEIRQFCSKYGKVVHISRPRSRDYVFLAYNTEDEAFEAQQNFAKDRIFCSYANTPKKLNVTDTTSNSSPSNPSNSNSSTHSSSPTSSSPDQKSLISPEKSPKYKRRVHFSTSLLTQQTLPSTSENQQSNQVVNGTTRSKDVTITPTKTVFRNGEKIIITYVQSASSFYAHPVSTDKERHELIKKMSQLAKTLDCMTEPQNLSMALAPFNRDYYRAMIKSQANSVNDLVLVTLVDIGSSFDVPFDKLKPIPNEYTNIRITKRFILAGVTDDSNQSYGAQCLESYIGNELTMKCDDESAGRLARVQIINPETKQNINDLIKEMQHSFNTNKLIRIPAPMGGNQTLITIDETKLASGFNLITFIDAKDLPEFNKHTERIQAIGNDIKLYPSYTPKKEELCLVNYNRNWHRAVFVERFTNSNNDDDCCVLLIDLCKAIPINPRFIRHTTTELVHMPILTFVAVIKGFGQNIRKTEVSDFMHKFKPMTDIVVTSLGESSENGIYTIDI